MTVMNADEFFSSTSDMLKAEDLKGHEVPVTIDGYEIKKFDDGDKMILSFKGKDKKLALNKTNGRMIATGLGSDFDKWSGGEIIMYPTTTEFGGNMVPCIRVRIPAKELDPNDDIPF